MKVLQWKQFLKLHALDIAAIDFFTLKRWGFSPLYCFFVIPHHRRELLHINVIAHPTSDWIKGYPSFLGLKKEAKECPLAIVLS
ncbi:MAG: hypothetical protein KDK39_11750 [Leptospiraceae bacterium]|nr:hypothetical protein [Leptospiraceae bacterium]